jgi:hypothetical protein
MSTQDLEALMSRSIALLRRAARADQPLGILWPPRPLALPLAILLSAAWPDTLEWRVIVRGTEESDSSPEAMRAYLVGTWTIRKLCPRATEFAEILRECQLRKLIVTDRTVDLTGCVTPFAQWEPAYIDTLAHRGLTRPADQRALLNTEVMERLRVLGYL